MEIMLGSSDDPEGEPPPESSPPVAENAGNEVCQVCGSVVSSDPVDLARHAEIHGGQPKPYVGEDLHELVRSAAKAALARRNGTQADLARSIGCSQKHISQMLSGSVCGSMEMWSKIVSSMDVQWSLALVERK